MTTTANPAPNLGEPTNVRFPETLVAAAKRAAACDGASSVSEWIRRMVEQEVGRREGKCPACAAPGPATPEPARWTALREHITRERAAQDQFAADHAELGHGDQSERAYGRVEALDRLLATMDRMEAGQ